jgi:hypothetical protein
MNKFIFSVIASSFFALTVAIGSAAPLLQDSVQSSTDSAAKPPSASPSNGTRTDPQSGQSVTPNSPSATSSAASENQSGTDADLSQKTTEQKKLPLKIGVAQITHTTDLPISTDGFQQELANQINILGGKAIILGSDPNDRDASNEEAKRQGCDYVVFSNIVGFRAAKVGEKLGRVFNRGGLGSVGGSSSGRVEMSADVKIFQPDNVVPVLNGNNNFRGTDPDSTANGLMRTEARTVMLQIRTLQKPPANANSH